MSELDAMMTWARARGEVLFYIPTNARRERAPAVTFAAMPDPRGGVK